MAENSSKGNPASHRMSNKALQSRRQACWNRGQTRHGKNKETNKQAALDNEATRSQGTLEQREALAIKSGSLDWSQYLTPHEAKRLRRRLVRDNLRFKGLIPRNEKEWMEKHPQRPNGQVNLREAEVLKTDAPSKKSRRQRQTEKV